MKSDSLSVSWRGDDMLLLLFIIVHDGVLDCCARMNGKGDFNGCRRELLIAIGLGLSFIATVCALRLNS